MLAYITQIYNQFLGYFPNFLHPIISLALAVLLAYSIFQALKKNFIFLIVLAVLLPAAVPILKAVGEGIIELMKFLLGAR